ncbi:MAG: helix-turn-helix domain-containing protein [Micrococcales bacterium]|nr:helix-turn-helix domain-containing protein [Micrococcales bacterium]
MGVLSEQERDRMGTALEAVPARGGHDEAGTRRRILQLVASDGPVCATELAEQIDVTPTGVRRHLTELERDGQITVHRVGTADGAARRGRPARRYVITTDGQAELAQGHADLAVEALRFLRDVAGDQAVEQFARQRAARLAERLGDIDASDVASRASAVADVLSADGYAATARPVPGVAAVQLCLGHCPVREVAEQFPQLCEAETRALAQVLGVHVQRLSTLAGGGHVCTTNIPTVNISTGNVPTVAPPAPSPEGTRA